jgi:hypothetical protein
MAAVGNGTTQYNRAGTTITAPTSYTYAFWYFPLAAAGTGSTRQPVGISNDNAPALDFDATFAWSHPTGTVFKAATHRVSGSAYFRCQIVSTPPFGVWIHLAVTYDGTNLKVYLNGVLENTVACGTQNVGNAPLITTNSYSPTTGFDNSPMAQFTMWNIALTAAEIKELAAGISGATIQTGSIISHFPMNAASDETIGPNMVNTGTTFNGTHFIGSTGGIGLGGGNFPEPIIYHETMSGGIALGGANIVPKMHYTFGMSGGIMLGGQKMEDFLQLGNGAFVMKTNRGVAQSQHER